MKNKHEQAYLALCKAREQARSRASDLRTLRSKLNLNIELLTKTINDLDKNIQEIDREIDNL